MRIVFGLLIFCYSLYAAEIVLYTEDYPPYQMIENGKLSGIGVDVVNEIKKRVNDTVEIRLTKWDTAYKQALSSKNVGVFSTGRTQERENMFKWVGPIGKTKYVFFMNKNNNLYIGNPDEASKKVKEILVGNNDVSFQVLSSLGIKNLKSSSDITAKENIHKIANNQADLWASDYYSGMYKINLYGYKDKIKPVMLNRPFLATTLNIAFNIGTDNDIIKRWSKTLDEIISDGTFDKIIKKYE